MYKKIADTMEREACSWHQPLKQSWFIWIAFDLLITICFHSQSHGSSLSCYNSHALVSWFLAPLSCKSVPLLQDEERWTLHLGLGALLLGPLWRIWGDSLLKDFWTHSPYLEGILGNLPALPNFAGVFPEHMQNWGQGVSVCALKG